MKVLKSKHIAIAFLWLFLLVRSVGAASISDASDATKDIVQPDIDINSEIFVVDPDMDAFRRAAEQSAPNESTTSIPIKTKTVTTSESASSKNQIVITEPDGEIAPIESLEIPSEPVPAKKMEPKNTEPEQSPPKAVKNPQPKPVLPPSESKKPQNVPDYFKTYKTIMYRSEDISIVEKGMENLFRRGGGAIKIGNIEAVSDALNSTISGGNEKMPEDGFMFVYLRSIMFMSKYSWAVWVNDIKITNLNNGDNELAVMDINDNKVTFLWTMSQEKWSRINYDGTADPNSYKVNANNDVELKFTLKPNQTFIAWHGKVAEGNIAKEKDEETSESSTGLGTSPDSGGLLQAPTDIRGVSDFF